MVNNIRSQIVPLNDLQCRGAQPPGAAPRGYSLSERLAKNGAAKTIGYVAQSGVCDNVELLLAAMAELVYGLGRTALCLTIVATKEDHGQLQGKIKEASLTDFVCVTSVLSGTPLEDQMARFDIAVCSPKPVDTGADQLRKMVLSFMAMGIPVVQCGSGVARQLVRDAVLYAHEDCPLELAGQIAALLDERILYDCLARNGRRRAETIRQRGAVMAEL